MKTLMVMRHAKSSWDDTRLSDHQRSLNARGLRDAPRMGSLLAENDFVPDQIVSSTAMRARTTAMLVAGSAGLDPDSIELRDEIYDSSPQTIFGIIRSFDDEHQRILLVGHNPTLEEIVEAMTGQHERMATATIAFIECNVDSWSDPALVSASSLLQVWRPREVDD